MLLFCGRLSCTTSAFVCSLAIDFPARLAIFCFFFAERSILAENENKTIDKELGEIADKDVRKFQMGSQWSAEPLLGNIRVSPLSFKRISRNDHHHKTVINYAERSAKQT